MSDHHLDLARTLWGEARGEGRAGMEAVANVVMNRVNDRRRWANNVTGVVRQPWQFSAWNANDRNRPQMLRVTTSDPQFRIATEIAREAIAGRLPDRTRGANHFYAFRLIRSPVWANPRAVTVVIGGHRFLRL